MPPLSSPLKRVRSIVGSTLLITTLFVGTSPVGAESDVAEGASHLAEPTAGIDTATFAASPAIPVSSDIQADAERGRRGLKNRDDAVNVFEVTYADGFSVEYARILRLYRAFFNREPDLGGTQFWLDRYDDGWTIIDIADFFAASTEFGLIYGDATDSDLVDLVYANVLDRTPDAAGSSYWLGRLNDPAAPISRGEMVTLFSDGIEFRARHPYPQPIEPGGPTPQLPAVPTGAAYTIDTAGWNIPTNGTDAPGTTANLQAAVDWAADNGFTKVVFPTGEYLVGVPTTYNYSGGITLHANTEYDLNGSVIQMTAHDRWNACALAIRNQNNVIVRNGTIRGDRDNHIYPPDVYDGPVTYSGDGKGHDEGHNLCVESGSSSILIEDMLLERANGDGILLVGNSSRGSVHDITIRNNEFNLNRRQGISIVGAIRVAIEDNEIHHTYGTAPQFGIDVESLSYESRDIAIRRNDFHHNMGGDIVNTDGRNVLIEYNTFAEGEGLNAEGTRPARNIDGPVVTWPRGDQTIRYNTFHVRNGSVNGKVAIIGYSSGSVKVNPATTYVYGNVSDGGGMYWYETSQLEVRDNTIIKGYLVMRDVREVVILDNEVSHSNKCWAYRFQNVAGRASGNTYAGTPYDIAINDGPWTGCWIN